MDTNLLVLLLIGRVNTGRIARFKRTQDFTVEDFGMLHSLIEWFGEPMYVTPHVLSQVSDLTDLSGYEKELMNILFRNLAAKATERHTQASELVKNSFFNGFGLADASIAEVCKKNILVITADVKLQIALGLSGRDALNFNHVRSLQ